MRMGGLVWGTIGVEQDPNEGVSGSFRTLRGGSWVTAGANMRSASRDLSSPSVRYNAYGFRVGLMEE